MKGIIQYFGKYVYPLCFWQIVAIVQSQAICFTLFLDFMLSYANWLLTPASYLTYRYETGVDLLIYFSRSIPFFSVSKLGDVLFTCRWLRCTQRCVNQERRSELCRGLPQPIRASGPWVVVTGTETGTGGLV